MAPGKWSKTPTSIAGLREQIQQNQGSSSQTSPLQSATLVQDTPGVAAEPQNEVSDIHVTRVKTKGKGMDRYLKAFGKIPVHILESKGRPINRVVSAKFSNELGIIGRSSIPSGTFSFKKLDDAEKAAIYERVTDRFNLIEDGPHVKRCIDTILASRLRDHVCRLHKNWKKLIEDGMSYGEARHNPPEGVEVKDWESRCDRWADEEYQGNPDRVEFYGKCYGGLEMNDFKSESAKENYKNMQCVKESYPEMAPDDIAETVLGKRSGRIAGLGFGPRPEKPNSLQGSSSRIHEELESVVQTQQEQLKSQDEELKSQAVKLKSQDDKIKKLEELVAKLIEDRNAST